MGPGQRRMWQQGQPGRGGPRIPEARFDWD